MTRNKRALISVTDKNQLDKIASVLIKYKWEIIATGGTKKYLVEHGFSVRDIEKITGNPEAFAGRMKTISFQVGAGILFRRKDQQNEADKLGVKSIDMVICNLYKFKEQKEKDASLSRLMEKIDIGGPFMIRAAAKNYQDVSVLVDPNDYDYIIDVMNENDGQIPLKIRYDLMKKAFALTASYDNYIANTMDENGDKKTLKLNFEQSKKLRYGENPHQSASIYKTNDSLSLLDRIKKLHGKSLSFNNIVDINSALNVVEEFSEPACAIIKHTNPCGLSSGDGMRKNLEKAWAGDPISAFGSIVAFNRKIDNEVVEFFDFKNKDKRKRKFIEVIIAPEFTKKAKQYLFSKKSLRIIEYNSIKEEKKDMKFLQGALLLQDTDNKIYEKLEVVTKRKPASIFTKELYEFGLTAVKHVKSNAIVIVRKKRGNFQLLGMGAGQPNRVVSVKLALDKAKQNVKNEFTGEEKEFADYLKQEMKKCLLVSDAFFPFPDNIEVAYMEGVKTIIQPGGSIRDKMVIKKCDELGCSMVFTGIRHFKH